MPLITHFMDQEGEEFPIAAAELATVWVPAADAESVGDWEQMAGGAYCLRRPFTNAPAARAVLQVCTDPSAITDHGLRVEYDRQMQNWVAWVDSLPETACALTLLFINHSTEDTPCVLPVLGVDAAARAAIKELQASAGSGTAATYYTVRVPAAGSAELYGWQETPSGYELEISDQAWVTEDMFLELKSENTALFTEHGLIWYPENGYLDLRINSLPEQESVVQVYVPNVVNGGELNGAVGA